MKSTSSSKLASSSKLVGVLLFIIICPLGISAAEYIDWEIEYQKPYSLYVEMIEEAKIYNRAFVRYREQFFGDLNAPLDYATEEQLKTSIEGIIINAKKYNYLYPEIHWLRVAKDAFGIMEKETRFVNFYELDIISVNNPKTGEKNEVALSFGTASMQWAEAKYLCKKYNIPFNKLELHNNRFLQSKLLILEIYDNLIFFDGDRIKAILAYNTGKWGVNDDTLLSRDYHIDIIQRIKERETEWYNEYKRKEDH